MEANVIWDIIKIVLGSLAGVIITALLPFIITLRREPEEKGKLRAETGSIDAETLSKLVKATGELQDVYTEALQDSKNREDELRKSVRGLEDKQKEYETRLSQMENLNFRVLKLTEENEKLTERVKELETIVKTLVEQIKELGHIPKIDLTLKKEE